MNLRTWSLGRLVATTITYWVVAGFVCGWLVVRWGMAAAARYQAAHPEAVDFLTTVDPHPGRLAAIMLLPPVLLAIVWWWARHNPRPVA